MSMGWDDGIEAAELFYQQNLKVDFHDWMSGRHWLGDKAPVEGFLRKIYATRSRAYEKSLH